MPRPLIFISIVGQIFVRMANDPHISDLLIAALTPPPSPRNPPHADRSLSGAYAAAPAVL